MANLTDFEIECPTPQPIAKWQPEATMVDLLGQSETAGLKCAKREIQAQHD